MSGRSAFDLDFDRQRVAAEECAMRYFVVFPVAFLAGLAVYVVALLGLFQQAISPGDVQAVCSWLALGIMVCGPCIYIPALLLLRYWLDSWEPLVAFGFLGAALGVFPVALVLAFMNSRPEALFSPEAFLFVLA